MADDINKVVKIISNEYIPPPAPTNSTNTENEEGENSPAIGKRQLLIKCIRFGREFLKMVDVSGEWLGYDQEFHWLFDTDD